MLGDATYSLTLIFTAKISFTALLYLHFTSIIFVYAYIMSVANDSSVICSRVV